VARPSPDEVPVTTTSFLSPKSGFVNSGVASESRSALDATDASPFVLSVAVVWKEPSRASSTMSPSSFFWTILPARPMVLPTTASTTVLVPLMSVAPTVKPPLPSSSNPSSWRFASCFALFACADGDDKNRRSQVGGSTGGQRGPRLVCCGRSGHRRGLGLGATDDLRDGANDDQRRAR
jgi:hypothetical protein